MRARYVSDLDLEVILDPTADPWKKTRAEQVGLIGTPIGLQPTDAIRVSWASKKIGAVSKVAVSALNDGRNLAFHLEWKDASENRLLDDTTSFADAVAILLPAKPGAPMVTMGAPGMPVNGWYWRADDADGSGRQIVAEGIGTSRTVDQKLVRGRGVWKGGHWHVVLARPLRIQTNEPVAQLEVGQKTQFGVAVWEGSASERGGVKAFSIDWKELVIGAAPTAGKR